MIKPTRYVAIMKPGDSKLTWYDRKQPEAPLGPLPEGCAETTFMPTGNFVARDDGEMAEIFVEEPTNA